MSNNDNDDVLRLLEMLADRLPDPLASVDGPCQSPPSRHHAVTLVLLLGRDGQTLDRFVLSESPRSHWLRPRALGVVRLAEERCVKPAFPSEAFKLAAWVSVTFHLSVAPPFLVPLAERGRDSVTCYAAHYRPPLAT